MAVYTDVAAEDLALFLAGYDIGELMAYKGIAEGVENSNFLVHTSRGYFILTLYERRVAERDLPFFLALMEHLARPRHHLPAAGQEPRRARRWAGSPAGPRRWSPSSRACGSGARAPRIARRWVRRWRGCISPAPTSPMQRENALSVAGWQQLYAACRHRANEVQRDLRTVCSPPSSQQLEREWPRGLPQGVIHADLFPDNVFFLGAKLSGLIDFYFACTDTLVYDVAICLNAWCFEPDHSYNVTKGRALLASYAKTRPLSNAEWEKLPLLSRGAALRFLLTRLVDWLNVPPGALVRPKDPIEYLRKLRFHQKIESPADYGVIDP